MTGPMRIPASAHRCRGNPQSRAVGRRSVATIGTVAIGMMLSSSISTAQSESAANLEALKRLSLEDLMEVRVTSVSRGEESLGGAAAAIAVLSNEDLRRSGATTFPEALRLVPGLHVARRNANSWAVSSRGFSSITSEKLLVLQDTRSIYSPFVSGVWWDVQDYLFEDIDRIEVIRGPGAALWGSNAVNGVINITTKPADATQGLYLSGAVGDEEEAIAAGRLGTQISDNAYVRVYATHSERDESFHRDAVHSDDWRMSRGGVRADWYASSRDSLSFQANVYRGNIGQLAPAITVIGREGPQGPLRTEVEGGHVLARWQRRLSDTADVQLRAYYDRTQRDDPSFLDELDTVDLDFQHHVAADRHDVTWGLNYRHTDSTNRGRVIFALDPPASSDTVASGFVQDQIAFSDALRVTVGTKVEHNDFSNWEVQPSLRAAWDPSRDHTVWAAVSRAVRVPTRFERDIAVDVTDPAANPRFVLLGTSDFEPEELLAWEAGYRWQINAALFLDAAAFYNEYDGLAALELGTPFVDPADGRTIVPVLNRNLNEGHSHGLELLLSYRAFERWRLTGTYTWTRLELEAGGEDFNRGTWLDGATPEHQFGLRSQIDLPYDLQLDAHLRHSSSLERLPEIVTGEGIDAYTELDVRAAWLGWPRTEVSLVGRNLLHARHTEFGTPQSRGDIERGVYGRIEWRF